MLAGSEVSRCSLFIPNSRGKPKGKYLVGLPVDKDVLLLQELEHRAGKGAKSRRAISTEAAAVALICKNYSLSDLSQFKV